MDIEDTIGRALVAIAEADDANVLVGPQEDGQVPKGKCHDDGSITFYASRRGHDGLWARMADRSADPKHAAQDALRMISGRRPARSWPIRSRGCWRAGSPRTAPR